MPDSKNHYYGILAEWYDRLLVEEKQDIAFYVPLISERGGTCLEPACGTGRLLIPLAKLGVEIDGVDISPDMLKICREKLEAENLQAGLYQQDIVGFNTGRKYDTIYISGGSFCMIDDLNEAMKCLANIYDHMKDDGLFILDVFNPTGEINFSDSNVQKMIRTAADDNRKMLCFACTEYNFIEQQMKGVYKYELYENNILMHTLTDEFEMRWYGKYEFKMLLEKAGFRNVEIIPANVMTSHKGTNIYKAYK